MKRSYKETTPVNGRAKERLAKLGKELNRLRAVEQFGKKRLNYHRKKLRGLRKQLARALKGTARDKVRSPEGNLVYAVKNPRRLRVMIETETRVIAGLKYLLSGKITSSTGNKHRSKAEVKKDCVPVANDMRKLLKEIGEIHSEGQLRAFTRIALKGKDVYQLIPKAGEPNGKRGIGMPTMRSKVAQEMKTATLENANTREIAGLNGRGFNYGFMSGDQCQHVAHATRDALQRDVQEGRVIGIAIDRSGAFDSPYEWVIVEALTNAGISAKDVKEYRQLLTVGKIFGEGYSEIRPGLHSYPKKVKSDGSAKLAYVEDGRGTPQGGVNSPRLFKLVMDDVMRFVLNDSECPVRGFTWIQYADDGLITGFKNVDEAKSFRRYLVGVESKRGLILNEDKSQIVEVSPAEPDKKWQIETYPSFGKEWNPVTKQYQQANLWKHEADSREIGSYRILGWEFYLEDGEVKIKLDERHFGTRTGPNRNGGDTGRCPIDGTFTGSVRKWEWLAVEAIQGLLSIAQKEQTKDRLLKEIRALAREDIFLRERIVKAKTIAADANWPRKDGWGVKRGSAAWSKVKYTLQPVFQPLLGRKWNSELLKAIFSTDAINGEETYKEMLKEQRLESVGPMYRKYHQSYWIEAVNIIADIQVTIGTGEEALKEVEELFRKWDIGKKEFHSYVRKAQELINWKFKGDKKPYWIKGLEIRGKTTSLKELLLTVEPTVKGQAEVETGVSGVETVERYGKGRQGTDLKEALDLFD